MKSVNPLTEKLKKNPRKHVSPFIMIDVFFFEKKTKCISKIGDTKKYIETSEKIFSESNATTPIINKLVIYRGSSINNRFCCIHILRLFNTLIKLHSYFKFDKKGFIVSSTLFSTIL